MKDPKLRPILDRRFRVSPAYQAVVFDRLPRDMQDSLRDLEEVPNLYGVLEPRHGGTYKAISRDVALLFFTLQEPGPLPSFVEELFGDDTNRQVARLVLDGTIEIEHEGAFVSGAAAHAAIHHEGVADEVGGRLRELSLAALRYAQTLEIDDIASLSARIYYYNRLPVTPFWRRTLSRKEEVLAFLKLEDSSPLRSRLDHHWRISRSSQAHDEGWIRWRAKNPKRLPKTAGRKNYKLYLSPRLRHLPETIAAAIDLFTEHQARDFKFGADAYNLLRPDKLVGYFRSFDDLTACARALARKLDGVPAHGVPFTVEFDGGGLLSWGVDPPPSEQLIGWQERESWRLWLTNRLANAIRLARKEPQRIVEPYLFALDRLEVEGVDTSTWSPRETLWDKTDDKE